jgi:integrase
MGVYTRDDSPYWWLWIETGKQREKTDIKVGETTAQRRESRRLATDRYHQRMNALAARLYQLPSAQPAIRFAKYAEPYLTDTIAHRKGAEREAHALKALRRFFDDDLLTAIDRDRVRAYHTFRKTGPRPAAAVTINREVALLKGMLRDAVPKYLTASPLVGMPHLAIVQARRRYTSEEEFTQLLAVCADAEDTAVLVLGRDTLVRLGDLLDLQHTDRTGSMIYIRDPKGGTAYEAALSPRALAAVQALDATASRYLFPKFRRALNARDWPGSVRQRLETLCKAADIPYGRTKHGVTFHWATRRSGATDLLMKRGKKLPAVQRLGNWKKPNVLLEIYTEVTTADLLEAVDAVPAKKRKRA